MIHHCKYLCEEINTIRYVCKTYTEFQPDQSSMRSFMRPNSDLVKLSFICCINPSIYFHLELFSLIPNNHSIIRLIPILINLLNLNILLPYPNPLPQ